MPIGRHLVRFPKTHRYDHWQPKLFLTFNPSCSILDIHYGSTVNSSPPIHITGLLQCLLRTAPKRIVGNIPTLKQPPIGIALAGHDLIEHAALQLAPQPPIRGGLHSAVELLHTGKMFVTSTHSKHPFLVLRNHAVVSSAWLPSLAVELLPFGLRPHRPDLFPTPGRIIDFLVFQRHLAEPNSRQWGQVVAIERRVLAD